MAVGNDRKGGGFFQIRGEPATTNTHTHRELERERKS